MTFDPSGDILQASDDLSRVINSYKKIVEGLPINGDNEEAPSSAAQSESGESFHSEPYKNTHIRRIMLSVTFLSLCTADTTDTLIDLAGLDTPSPPQPVPPPSFPMPVSTNPSVSSIPVLPPPPKHLLGCGGSQSSSPSHPPQDKASALSLLDDELLSLGNYQLSHNSFF